MTDIKKRFTFTIIELVVVIAVIATLLSLLMPAINRATGQGKNLVCQNNLKTLFIADDFYAEENNEHYVVIKPKNWNYVWFRNKTYLSYLGDMEQLRYDFEYACPNYEEPSYFGFSYAPNWTNDKFWWNGFSGQSILRNRVSNAATKIKMIETTDWHANTWQANPTRWFSNGEEGSNTITYRHFKGCNMTFLDGHVEYRIPEDVYFNGDDDKREDLWVIDGNSFSD